MAQSPSPAQSGGSWRQAFDDASQRSYWYEVDTRKTSWTAPQAIALRSAHRGRKDAARAVAARYAESAEQPPRDTVRSRAVSTPARSAEPSRGGVRSRAVSSAPTAQSAGSPLSQTAVRAIELAAQIQKGEEAPALAGLVLTQPPLSRELSSEGKKAFYQSVSLSDDDRDVDGAPDSNKTDQDLGLETVGAGEWKRGRLIGQGSFGRVYQGLNLRTGALLAIKELNFAAAAEGGSSDGGVEAAQASFEHTDASLVLLEREINVMRRLRHPNIVTYKGSEKLGHRLVIFQEWVPGGSLKSLIDTYGQPGLSHSIIPGYTRQILKGLAYLHEQRIIHRDIKPGNILVHNSGVVKLADFGASITLKSEGDRSVLLHDMQGTPLYMAPEVLRQAGYGRAYCCYARARFSACLCIPLTCYLFHCTCCCPHDASTGKADVFSVGGTVLKLATGQAPWQSTTDFTDLVSVILHISSAFGMLRLDEHW